MVKKWYLLAFGASALVCSSCGDSSGLYPVTGKVLFHGKPAVGATVTFVRKGAANAAQELLPQGVVGEDGTFSVSSSSGQGALPGEFIVLVEWKDGAGKVRGRAPALNAPDRFKKKYLNPNNPLLLATVEPKFNTLPPFELN